MADICGDNRFELIAEFKRQIIEASNIESSPDEMAVIDSILFREWQMGWLDRLISRQPRVMTLEEVASLQTETDVWIERFHKNFSTHVIAATAEYAINGDGCYLYVFGNPQSWHDYKCVDYGKTWRCWTSRPDDTTREDAKWNEPI